MSKKAKVISLLLSTEKDRGDAVCHCRMNCGVQRIEARKRDWLCLVDIYRLRMGNGAGGWILTRNGRENGTMTVNGKSAK